VGLIEVQGMGVLRDLSCVGFFGNKEGVNGSSGKGGGSCAAGVHR